MQYFAYNADQTVISITTRVNKHYYYYKETSLCSHQQNLEAC